MEYNINEDADLRKNKGIPSDFMSKAEREARTNLEINIDDTRQMMPQEMGGRDVPGELKTWLDRVTNILYRDEHNNVLNDDIIQERIKRLESLAERVVRDEFGEILELSPIPIEFDIKLVKIGDVANHIDLSDVSRDGSEPSDVEQQKQDEKDQERDEDRIERRKEEPSDESDESEEESEEQEQDKEEIIWNELEDPIPGTKFSDAIDKKKILNMITQAAGKNVKNIMRYSELVKTEITDMFGSRGRTLLTSWFMLSEIAEKMDWIVPLEQKASSMKGAQSGMAGAVDIIWESHSGNFYDIEYLLEKEATKITIKAVGVDFPMLIHEAVKGVYMYLQSGAIKKDKETAKIIKAATSSFMDESQDFRYGPQAYRMLLLFINEFDESNEYSKLDTRVFTILSIDKERAIAEFESSKKEWKEFFRKRAEVALTDKEFLEVMKSIFSTVDLNDGGSYILNKEKFNTSIAKIKIQSIIDYIVDDIEGYKRDIAEWEEEQRLREQPKEDDISYPDSEEESDIDRLVKQALQDDTEDSSGELDYSKLSQREIQDLIDSALDDGDYEKVSDLSQYLESQGQEIYLRELERINEKLKYRRK